MEDEGRHPTAFVPLIDNVGLPQVVRSCFMFGYKANHGTGTSWFGEAIVTKHVIAENVGPTLRELGREKWSVRGDVIGENTPDGSRFA